jgi:phosphoglycerate dehydrogenase-like enzyme
MSQTDSLRLVLLGGDPALHPPLADYLAPFGDRVRLDFADAGDASALAEADGVLCGSLPAELRAQSPRLRYIQFWSAGVDRLLYPALFANGATVATGSGVHAAAASEHVLSMMLAFARGLPRSFAAQQAHDWSRSAEIGRSIFELDGKTVGIVGAGVIGQAIGKRCQAFGMRTIGTRRDPNAPTEGIDVLLSHLQYHDLILESDFIVLALPLTPGTQMIFGEDEIEILRKGTYFFNIGRGGLVDETWLLRALQNGWLAGAGLDVFAEEPLRSDSPFWDLPNCIITPHVGGQSPSYWPRFARLVADQVDRLLSNRPLRNQVDRDLGY